MEGISRNIHLRRLTALFIAIAFAVAVFPAKAEVVETKTATVYTGADAAEKARYYKDKYGLQIRPKKAYIKEQNGDGDEIRLTSTTSWDAGCEEYTYCREVLTTLDKLELKIPQLVYILPRQQIFILPLYSFTTSSTKSDALGIQVSKRFIYLAGQHKDATYNLLHEIGHSVADALFSADGYDWSGINSLGREYLRIRGYRTDVSLADGVQLMLPWSERAAEWFAEDFAYWVACKIEMDRHIKIPGTGSEEVMAWFDKIFDNIEKHECL